MSDKSETHHIYLQRCRQLAELGTGKVSPNPRVGALLLARGRIIGEGWHRRYGQAHAEVNAVASVAEVDRPLLREATIYVSLEPCCIHGNTPPCTDLIIREGIPQAVIGSLDRTPGVNGQGVNRLREAGVKVIVVEAYPEPENPASIRNHFVRTKRPYTVLKFARSRDGYLGRHQRQVWLSHPLTRRLVHKWRAETDAIMVGTQTALVDNPSLTTRYFYGKDPVRVVPDRRLRLPPELKIFEGQAPTWVFTRPGMQPRITGKNLRYFEIPDSLEALMKVLYKEKISQLLVEGGRKLLAGFLEANLWDEARILTADRYLHHGIRAPQVSGREVERFRLGSDEICRLRNTEGES